MERESRLRDKDRDDRLDRIESMLAKITEEVDFLALEKRAKQLVNVDSDLVGLPWRGIENVALALDSVDKIEAIQRLLQSPAVSTSQTRYFSDVFDVFFAKDIRGCFYNGLAHG